MESVPAPRLFQYMDRSTMTFFGPDIAVTTTAARPLTPECSLEARYQEHVILRTVADPASSICCLVAANNILYHGSDRIEGKGERRPNSFRTLLPQLLGISSGIGIC